MERIAGFLDVSPDSLDRSRCHLYKARKKSTLLTKIDKGFLEHKVGLYCREAMDKYFPEIRDLQDALDCEGNPLIVHESDPLPEEGISALGRPRS